ncbi:MAG: PfkB family carbohydrate kinase [Gemmataceae bacterium]
MSANAILSEPLVESILRQLPRLTLGVVGDLFLDRYLEIDATLTETSLETGLDAYQVVRVRSQPGAAGTVINNLAALGIGCIRPLSVVGEDGEGFELLQALRRMPALDLGSVVLRADRRTPTYTKPMLHEPGAIPRELNRLDIHNRTPLSDDLEAQLLERLTALWEQVDGMIVLDQVSWPDCGVVTRRLRDHLAHLAGRDPKLPVLADSRAQIGLFREVALKPNAREALAATGSEALESALEHLAHQANRPVFCTRSEDGIRLVEPGTLHPREIPGYPVVGPIDPVGAGDSTSAGILSALAAGATLDQAAALGNLVASITVQQLGTTGTATPTQVRARLSEVLGKN